MSSAFSEFICQCKEYFSKTFTAANDRLVSGVGTLLKKSRNHYIVRLSGEMALRKSGSRCSTKNAGGTIVVAKFVVKSVQVIGKKLS